MFSTTFLDLPPLAGAAGTVRLVGTDVALITRQLRLLLSDVKEYEKMSFSHNPYGDGKSSERIVQALLARR